MQKGMKMMLWPLPAIVAVLCSMLCVQTVCAETVYESPYVTFSPDGRAFTTNASDQNVKWYDYGTVVDTGAESSLPSPGEGEHYYRVAQSGQMPVGKWQIQYKTGSCCHKDYPPLGVPYHDLVFGRQPCGAPYYSGWIAYCADCDEPLISYNVYMSREAAASITALDLKLNYYYLCPFCSNLEQGVPSGSHWCREISWNRYQVRYESNAGDWVGGYMENSLHMYNNETVYEGREVTPIERLSKNTYVRTGYEFAGWNTEPDGSGRSFADQEKILNLTNENYDELGGGVVVLYAQWKKSASLLRIDPGEGSYQGKKGITELWGEYGTSCCLNVADLTPPAGARVAFETGGGTAIMPVTGTMSFGEWSLADPFYGRFKDNVYYYTAASESVDTITAVYQRDAMILPGAEKAGSSFGGWYYDPECSVPAGKEGDTIVPETDMTLYAKWVELVLYAEDNYAANVGKGAVDLRWAQNDGQDKSYMIYQSTDNSNWKLVTDAQDVGSTRMVDRTFSYSGREQAYVVPYTGVYTLTVNGAQGACYGEYAGGYGGRVTCQVWLEKGERLTYRIGGQEGFNGGGSGTAFAGGGGCTIVTSNLKGTLVIAGGGGGATVVSDGGAGGSAACNLSTGPDGESGQAGGGGGYRGGTAGETVFHYHSEECYVTKDTSYTVMRNSDYLGKWAQEFEQLDYCFFAFGSFYAGDKNIWGAGAHGKDRETAGVKLCIGEYLRDGGVRHKYIPTEGNEYLNIHITADSNGPEGALEDGRLTVWDQNEQIIFDKPLSQVTRYWAADEWSEESINSFLHSFEEGTGGRRGSDSGWYSYYNGPEYTQYSLIYWNEQIKLPEGTIGVRMQVNSQLGPNEVWFSSTIEEISFSGSETIRVCAYETDGQLVSSRPSYGGSNYVNAQYVTDYTQHAGVQPGNGSFSIKSLKVGYQDELFLKGVKAEDKAPPCKIAKESISKNAVGESALSISWAVPLDIGTDYYHRAESFQSGSTDVLSHSNVTKNTLVSGVAGYYYVVDENPLTQVTASNASGIKDPVINVELSASKQYLHVAAFDKAGNIGEAVHIEIGKADEEVAWPIRTEVLKISADNGSVYAASGDTYYVRSDGKSGFRVDAEGFILGQATAGYQVNHLMYRMQTGSDTPVILDIYVPGVPYVTDRVTIYSGSDITKALTGRSDLKDDSYTVTRRSDHCRRLSVEQRFVMAPAMDRKKMWVVPVAGADFGEEMITSDWEEDQTHGVWLIGDSTVPGIAGAEAMEKFEDTQPVDGKRTFVITAADTGSGVKEFYAVVTNSDNGSRRRFVGTGGELVIVADEKDPLFQGDIITEFHAIDLVGNEAIKTCLSEGFALTAYVERIVEPHQPVFRCGESGCLTITAYGYPDKIEVIFPEELTAMDPGLNIVYEYEGTVSRREEQYLFMIPLGAPKGEFGITVKAWKEDRVISKIPVIWTLGEDESVLDDIRTRLR